MHTVLTFLRKREALKVFIATLQFRNEIEVDQSPQGFQTEFLLFRTLSQHIHSARPNKLCHNIQHMLDVQPWR